MNNYNDFPITEVAKDELYKIMEQKYNDGYRLAQILSVAYEGYNEVIYSVATTKSTSRLTRKSNRFPTYSLPQPFMKTR